MTLTCCLNTPSHITIFQDISFPWIQPTQDHVFTRKEVLFQAVAPSESLRADQTSERLLLGMHTPDVLQDIPAATRRVRAEGAEEPSRARRPVCPTPDVVHLWIPVNAKLQSSPNK
jgi:hypothetical protein